MNCSQRMTHHLSERNPIELLGGEWVCSLPALNVQHKYQTLVDNLLRTLLKR